VRTHTHTKGLLALALAAGLAAPLAGHAACGDGVRDGTDACDGTDFGESTCTTVTGGFAPGGTLACKADCTLDTTDCRRAFLESLVPAARGPAANRCHLEWGTVGTSAVPNKPTNRTCSEGDPTCDQDRQFNNACRMRIQICFNVPDPRIQCAPGRIIRFDLLAPKVTSPQQEAAASILQAASEAAIGASAIEGNGVRFGPPIQDFSCGATNVTVPLRGKAGRAKKGKLKIRARTSDNSGKVRSIGLLTLTCTP
jgi:hypothetical protein